MLGLDLSEDGDLLFSSGGDSVVNVSFFLSIHRSRSIEQTLIERRSGRRGLLLASIPFIPTMTWAISLPLPTLPVSRPFTVVVKTPASRYVWVRFRLILSDHSSGAISPKRMPLRRKRQKPTCPHGPIASSIHEGLTAPVLRGLIQVQMVVAPSRRAAKC